ncbi:beta-mannosidase [Nonlabens ulvanivorans]|uniref:Beta-mannosidase n=1 Tax=Nonlabens ulvanivorans TaxID=906888 RepID=A0A090X365_NONUL|nr:beta-mannosidase [Nonlabens ulvanivorans]
MFACAMYPGDARFRESVTNEITQQITRLRNHSSIALWCGNNETSEAWHNWAGKKEDLKPNAIVSGKIIEPYFKSQCLNM